MFRQTTGSDRNHTCALLRQFVDTGLVAMFNGRHYLPEPGMRRAANMSRVLPSVIRSRHAAHLDRWYREQE